MEFNLFSLKLFQMSTENIQELKSLIIKKMEDNLLSIEDKMESKMMKHKDFTQKQCFLVESYKEKQQQVDNLANFMIQFLSNLQQVFQQMNFKDKKISDLNKELQKESDFITKLNDQIFQYKDKLINAEEYIHWMQQQMQYFDLLCMSNPLNTADKKLEKCRSQKTLTSSDFSESESLIQKKRKVDYQRIKFYIQNLKQQKNQLIKQYNKLMDEHERKVHQCQKHSILLDQLFQKYHSQQTQSNYLKQSSARRSSLPLQNNFLINKRFYSNCKHQNVENQLNSKGKQNHDFFFDNLENNHSRIKFHHQKSQKMVNDYNGGQQHSVVESFVSQFLYHHNLKLDVGINTKKIYCTTASTQTYQVQFGSQMKANLDVKMTKKSKISQKTTMQDSHSYQKKDFECQISINLKNIEKGDITKIDFSKLIRSQLLVQKNEGYTHCHRQKRKGSKHLCQHMYCYLTNKVVTQRIKKYKYLKKQK